MIDIAYRAINKIRHISKNVEDIDFVVVDLELTGLDASVDEIVSMAWVPIRNLSILVGEAEHYYVKTKLSVGKSATIHGIHDRDLSDALDVCKVMNLFYRKFSAYTWVSHCSELDSAFIARALKYCKLADHHRTYVDTLKVEYRRMSRKGLSAASNHMTLGECLYRNNIPYFCQHDAMADAFGCAQLFLCQVHKSGKERSKLYEFL